MKVAVTGYRGFIASHLIPELKNHREKLVLIEIDDYPIGNKFTGCNAVIHLGAIAGARPGVDPYYYFENNVRKTVDLLEAARKSKVRKFIFISTCTITHGIKNIYDISKLQGEQWCKEYRRYFDDLTILRLYNVYGERDTKSVVYKFVHAVKKGRPIVIHGDGKQTRDFIYVKDIVRGITKVLYSKKPFNDVFDVGTGKEISIQALGNLIFRLSGKTVPITHEPLPYPQLRHAKCSRPLFVSHPLPLNKGIRMMLQN